MSSRVEFQKLLETITPNVYFQQPSSTNMKYPAIVYSLKTQKNLRADNCIYGSRNCYDVQIMDRNPDSPIAISLSNMRHSQFDRQFVKDGLNHISFVIYY